MPWEPSSTVIENWGRPRVVIDDVDVSFYLDVATVIRAWTDAEPFGFKTAEIHFPQITPFAAIPSWLHSWANVDIYRVDEANYGHKLWEGLVADLEDSLTEEGSGMTLQALGALYQADLSVSQPVPWVQPDPIDIGYLITHALNPAHHPSWRWNAPPIVITGITAQLSGSWNPTVTGYIQDILSKATTPDGQDQWTVYVEVGRRPLVQLKDKTTVHWTVHVGAPGVTHDLSLDHSMAPNVIYGEGTDANKCHWRNTKYPNLRADDAPIYPGSTMSPGSTNANNTTWQQELFDQGWTGFTPNTYYDPGIEQTLVRRFQQQAGILVDGVVGPQTWAAIFQTGSNAGDLTGAYFAPLYIATEVEPYTYSPNGAITGNNPNFDPDAVRVERYENFGTHVSKEEAIASAIAEAARDNPAAYAGTITLKADPQEGSRFDIRGGDNIKLRGHHGVDRMLHVAEANIDLQALTVTCTVDEKARDILTLAAILDRDRENTDPGRRKQKTYKNSRAVNDEKAVWDCENGSGIIPLHATYHGLWNVLRIPAGNFGTIVRSEFTLTTPARFSVAVFDRQTSHIELNRVSASPLDQDYWDVFDENSGLIQAWGGYGQAGGFYPGQESDLDPLTGRLVDNASWYFESTTPPYLWVAIWVESPTTNYCSGRLFPGLD